MRSLIRLVTFSSCLLIALSGCANSPTQDSRETDTATAAKPSPTKVPVNPGDDLKIECSNADRTIKTSFSPPQEAWETPRENRDNCTTSYISQLDFSNEGPIKYYVLTDIEEKALEVADYDGIDSLSTLYNICAKADLGDLGESKPWRAGQIQEVSAALVLCPDHPDRKEVEKRMKKGEVKENAREDGKIFNSGTYKVGADGGVIASKQHSRSAGV
ncbi:hypothetical protein AB0365_11965 [Brevibacterium casei]|uniref:hypothetical protein n=1 Tax=Brevibacterium casei TaxID=33889 RepID=UPI00344F4AB7